VKCSKGDSASPERELAVRPPMADGGSAPAREGRTQWPLQARLGLGKAVHKSVKSHVVAWARHGHREAATCSEERR
jgi:hypothetical protein